MIDRFENVARIAPTREFLSAIDETGKEQTFTYREARLISAAIALRLRQRGVGRTSYVALDLANTPEFVLMMLAAAYGPFPIALLDPTLSAAEKSARLRALADAGIRVHCVIDGGRAAALRAWAVALLEGGEDAAAGVDDGFQPRLYGGAGFTDPRDAREIRESLARDARGFGGRSARDAREGGGRSARDARPLTLDYESDARGSAWGFESNAAASKRAFSTDRYEERLGRDHRRPLFSDQQDALDDVIHFAEQVHRSFDESAPALILFSTTTSARPRPLELRWSQLTSVANATARVLGERSDSLSQIVMPLYEIQGISQLVRAITAGHGLRIYRQFDPDRVLWDAVMFKTTHLTLSGPMLKRLLMTDSAGALRGLSCLLVDGRTLKPTLAERTLDAHLPMYVSFGCPETAGLVAVSRLRAEEEGGLKLLEGVSARVLECDGTGYGSLAVAGPGLFSGYLSGRTPFTVDGFFLSGDRAALVDGLLFVRERPDEVYRCGGELVSLEEIERVLAHVPGVLDVHVMDVRDDTLGRRPVALLERAPGIGSELTINSLRPMLKQCFAPMTMPKHLCFTDELPTDKDGLVDGARAGELYRRRIEVRTVKILRPRAGVLRIEVSDDAGRLGVGEISFRRAPLGGELGDRRAGDAGGAPVGGATVDMSRTFSGASTRGESGVGRAGDVGVAPVGGATTDMSRTFSGVSDCDEDTEFAVLRTLLAPMVVREAFLHPREVAAALLTVPEVASARHAAAALEMACWDLYAVIVGRPLERVLADEYDRLAGPAVRKTPGHSPVDLTTTVSASPAGIESALARLASHPH